MSAEPDERAPRGRPRARDGRRREDDRPNLPERAAEDTDAAWGDEPGGRDDDWYRRERPPHHE